MWLETNEYWKSNLKFDEQILLGIVMLGVVNEMDRKVSVYLKFIVLITKLFLMLLYLLLQKLYYLVKSTLVKKSLIGGIFNGS